MAKTSIFTHTQSEWRPPVARNVQSISTVMLDDREKEGLLQDVHDFLASSQEEHHDIRHRRCYLFYGPTGTGKTCLALSIAGCFGLDTYITELSVNDNSLRALFTKAPGSCVILLEDVENAKPEPPQGAASLSALLDAIDSIRDGHVIIMTTRHLELVDNALTGRADVTTEFRLANKEMISRLFRFAFQEHEAVDLLAYQFATKIPELEFSPAEVMSFLAGNFLSPEQALCEAEKWMATVRYERGKMKGKV
jgi:mitochondrial chaperone BCS1